MEAQIKNEEQWIIEQFKHVKFGEIGIKFIVHEGRIKRVERSISEKVQS